MVLALSEQHIIQAFACASGGLSLVGSLLLIFSYYLFSELRTPSSRLILSLTIADLGSAIAFMLSPWSYNPLACVIQGTILQYFELAGIFWQICIASYILQVDMHNGIKGYNKQEVIYHLVAWGVPLIVVICGAVKGIFGFSGAWCWVSGGYSDIGLLILYLPCVVGLSFIIFVYIRVTIRMNRRAEIACTVQEKIDLEKRQQLMKSKLYLLPFILGWVFGLINRVHNLIIPNPIFAIYLLHGLLHPTQGFWNFMTYGFTERIVRPDRVKDLLKAPLCRPYFGRFLESLHARENLDFWVEIEQLKTLPSSVFSTSDWGFQGQIILNEYLVPGAPQEINISSFVRKSLMTKFTWPALQLAQQEAVDLMEPFMVSFHRSSECAQMVTALEQSSSSSFQGMRLILAIYYRIRTGTRALGKPKQFGGRNNATVSPASDLTASEGQAWF